MPLQFWIWVLYFAIVVGGWWYGYGKRDAANRFWFAPHFLIALLLFAICWVVAGNPVHALIKAG